MLYSMVLQKTPFFIHYIPHYTWFEKKKTPTSWQEQKCLILGFERGLNDPWWLCTSLITTHG